MSIQHWNDVRTIDRLLKSIGAKLPEEIEKSLEHLNEISAGISQAPTPGNLARDLGVHLGNPAAFEKARKAAADELARAEANTKINGFLIATCAARLHQSMRLEAETISSIVAVALQPDIDALNEGTGRLPAYFRAEHAAELDSQTFAIWRQVETAYARVHGVAFGLASFYRGATAPHHDHFPAELATSLRFANPGTPDNPTEGYALRSALAGRRERPQGLAGQGSTFVDGLFIPTTLAHAGATFEWAGPATVADRAERIVSAIASAPAAPALV